MNRYHYDMIVSLSVLNEDIIRDRDAAFELVNDFSLTSGSPTINKMLEQALCANDEKQIDLIVDEAILDNNYKIALKDILKKICLGDSFTVDDYLPYKRKEA